MPHPIDQNPFWKLAGFGTQLRRLHLLESSTVKKYIDETNEILKKTAEIKIKKNP